MPAPDLKAHLERVIRLNSERLVKDLNALPAEQQCVSPGGCAHNPVHLVAECGVANGFIAAMLRGEQRKPGSPEEREAYLASFDTAEKAVAHLTEQTDRLLEAIAGLSEESLGEEISFFGRMQSRYAVAEFTAFHMAYHDGQLNYCQALHGDAEIHW